MTGRVQFYVGWPGKAYRTFAFAQSDGRTVEDLSEEFFGLPSVPGDEERETDSAEKMRWIIWVTETSVMACFQGSTWLCRGGTVQALSLKYGPVRERQVVVILFVL